MSYGSGHPWYYVLGGEVLSIKQIWKSVYDSGYKGCFEGRISKLAGNDLKLEKMKADDLSSLNKDISRYRECALALHRYRLENNHEQPEVSCDDVHTNISLKHNHIFNDPAHLTYIDQVLSKQL